MRDAAGVPKPKLDAAGKPVPFHVAYPAQDDKGNFLSHASAGSVVGVHNFGWAFIQATVAILILVGFESVTAMGGEAKNAKRDVPIAVIVSLLVQGVFCYLFEYFAANYFLNSGYTMQSATGLGGAHRRHDDHRGQRHVRRRAAAGSSCWCEAFTVFLALIGTTLSCMNTGRARHLRHGQGQGSAGALRLAAFQEPDAAPGHLDAGGDFGGGGLRGGGDGVRRRRRADRRHHQGAAAGLLVELRLHHARSRWRPCRIRC